MNRKEAVIYLMDNPKAKLRCIKDIYGENASEMQNYIEVKHGHLKWSTGVKFDIVISERCDKSEFEVVRELRKMSFGEAYFMYTNRDDVFLKNVRSCVSGNTYLRIDREVKKEEFMGEWTIDGFYDE